jgi:hypothetical protein
MLTILRTNFNLSIPHNDITLFRGALNERVQSLKEEFVKRNLPTDLFHNHEEVSGENQNRYPLIQYRSVRGQLEIWGYDVGADALRLVLKHADTIPTRDGDVELRCIEMKEDKYALNESPLMLEYRMYHWVPMHPGKYKRWITNDQFSFRLQLIDSILRGNLRTMLEAFGHEDTRWVQSYISNITEQKWVKRYGQNELAFNITFRCNVHLPDGIAIGRGTSIGFGKVLPLTERRAHAVVVANANQLELERVEDALTIEES